MLAHDLDPGALAHEGHQRVAGQEALRMMDQGYLMPVHRVRGRQQLEVAEMRAQHDDPAAGVARLISSQYWKRS